MTAMPLNQPLVPLLPDAQPGPVAPVCAPALSHLRVAGLACRAAPRRELFTACALLQVERTRHAGAYATALVQGLPEALGTRPVFLAPGEAKRSFDEAWLLRAMAAHRAGDRASFDFLIRSRITVHAHRSIGYLIAGLADATIREGSSFAT
ncbi:MAG: hypothetical protein AAGM21_04660 [Pseudomonadota bacterium]